MDICVLGAGSLGSLIGGLLAREHTVTLVGREPHVSAVERDGLRVTGEFDLTVEPAARTDPPDAVDLAVVTVKSFDTPDAARALDGTRPGCVLSLQNGMGNERQLAEALSPPVLAGTCTYGARLVEPGVVECTGVGEIALGPWGGGTVSTADRVGAAADRAGLAVTVAEDMPRRLWEKLAVNAAINPTTALARVKNGALVSGPLRETAAAAARETAQVARSRGIELNDGQATGTALAVAETTAANTSSMHQDVLAGTRTEIEAINGHVVEAATAPVPVNRTLAGLVRAWERRRELRE